MNIGSLKNESPFSSRIVIPLSIISYGVRNDIPQVIQKIVYSSPTACDCINIFRSFLYRGGFEEEGLGDVFVNSDGETMNTLLEKIVNDYAIFGSFAIHIVENELFYVPFEYVRMGVPDTDYHVNYYAVFQDWTGEKVNINSPYARPITEDQITYIHAFVANPMERLQQMRSDGFIGQLYYYNNNSMTQYPLPIHYSALTDMSTEAGLTNLSYRNARMNFFPAGIMTMVDTESKNTIEMNQRKEEISARIREFQGDCNAGKLLYVPIDDPNNVPQFIPFQTQNLDSMFSTTTQSVQDRIGRVFNQPPILRGEDVGSNFGADAIANAYQFYNSICESHRKQISDALSSINEVVGITSGTITIQPCEYISKDDIKKFDNEEILTIQQILGDDNLDPDAKKKLLVMAFGMDDEDAEDLVKGLREKEKEKAKMRDAMQNNFNNANNNDLQSSNTTTQDTQQGQDNSTM